MLPELHAGGGAWANLYQVVRRAASAHHLSFPYTEKDFVLLALLYSEGAT